MKNTRDFDAMLAEKAGVRPTFKVAGQEFTLRAKLPWRAFMKLLAAMRDDSGDDMAATQQFFQTTLIRADRERFAALLENDGDDDDNVVDFVQLQEITSWALETFTGKNEESTNGSSPGAKETGQQPNVVSLSSKKAANA